MRYLMFERIGDRGGNGGFSFKEYAFTIPANPMSDRGQLVLEIHDSLPN